MTAAAAARDEDRAPLDAPYAMLPLFILQHPELKSGDVHVFAMIAARADRMGRAQCSLAWIAAGVKVTVRCVQNRILKMERLGLVVKAPRPGDRRGQVYYVIRSAAAALAAKAKNLIAIARRKAASGPWGRYGALTRHPGKARGAAAGDG